MSDIDAAVTGKQTLAESLRTARHAEPTAVQLGALVVDASGSASYLVPFLGRTAAAEANEGAATTSTADFHQTTLSPRRFYAPPFHLTAWAFGWCWRYGFDYRQRYAGRACRCLG